MRTAFIEELCTLAHRDPNIWLVCGDLGYSVLEEFSSRFPGRFVNAGVAEQNMAGVAAGLALAGKTVFTYSIANFPVMRCLEQVRNDICYHQLDVKIVAVGGGFAYSTHGYTHHGVEDLAVMSALPNLVVSAPGDPAEARAVTRSLAASGGPAYIRLGKAGEPEVHTSQVTCPVGEALLIRPGSDVTLMSTGGMLATSVAAADRLREFGVAARVLSVPYVVPLDREAVLRATRETQAIVTLEEHGYGGLGTAVADVIATSGRFVLFRPLRLRSTPVKVAGSQRSLLDEQGLGLESIRNTVLELLAVHRPV